VEANRDPLARVTPEGVAGSRGSYGLVGYELAEYGGVAATDKPGCFGANVETWVGEDELRLLDRIPLGGRVAVQLQPLTPSKRPGRPVLGKSYVFHPKMRTADHLFNSDDAQRQLATIGC
jgi:hypothetical protein